MYEIDFLCSAVTVNAIALKVFISKWSYSRLNYNETPDKRNE